MNARFTAPDDTPATRAFLSAVLDHASLDPTEVSWDPDSGVVSIPVVRYPLLEQRRVRGNVNDSSRPIPAVVTVRQATSCRIDRAEDGPSRVTLLFGLDIRDRTIRVSSAEEVSGEPCFLMEVATAELDVELTDA